MKLRAITTHCALIIFARMLGRKHWQEDLHLYTILGDVGIEEINNEEENSSWVFDQQALQQYILIACQEFDGGIKDKPGKYVAAHTRTNK